VAVVGTLLRRGCNATCSQLSSNRQSISNLLDHMVDALTGERAKCSLRWNGPTPSQEIFAHKNQSAIGMFLMPLGIGGLEILKPSRYFDVRAIRKPILKFRYDAGPQLRDSAMGQLDSDASSGFESGVLTQ
jgi:hypothetical protein